MKTNALTETREEYRSSVKSLFPQWLNKMICMTISLQWVQDTVQKNTSEWITLKSFFYDYLIFNHHVIRCMGHQMCKISTTG